MRNLFLALVVAAPLGACSTTSFAPPSVNPQVKSRVGGASGCVSTISSVEITRDVKGAMALTDNFILAYRCAERELANGRQIFQLPSFAAAIVGLVGPTLGLGTDGGLIAGTTASVFNGGNSYYAPRAKAGIVSAATRAVLCIKSEAAGVGYFQLVADEEVQSDSAESQAIAPAEMDALLDRLKANARDLEMRRASDPAADRQLRDNWAQQQAILAAMVNNSLSAFAIATSSDGSIYLPAEVQYFEMVSSALFSVETILGERLRDAGNSDTKAIFDQLSKLAEEHAAARKKLDEAKKAKDDQGDGEVGSSSEAIIEERNIVELENAVLRPKLQTCILQARA